MASTYVYRNCDATANGGYTSKFTISAWVKRGNLGEQGIFMQRKISHVSQSRIRLRFTSADRLGMDFKDSSSNDDSSFETNALYRDVNAWYHIVFSFDSTQGTEANRLKVWVNGVDIRNDGGGFSSVNEASNGFGALFSSAARSLLGITTNNSNADAMFDGSMSHVHFTYGYTYDANVFGSQDATTGEWKINASPTIANYGSQGFFVLKDGNSGTDQSGQGNNMTIDGGTLTKTEDNPSNVFCTLNPLQEPDTSQAVTYSFGNTKFSGNWNHWQRCYGTIGANTGKFYYEFKCLNDDGTAGHLRLGWDSIDNINIGTTSYFSGLTLDREGKLRGGISGVNDYSPDAVQMTQAYSGGNFSYTANDILGMAIDLDNQTISVYKNGNLEINAHSYASYSNCSLLKSKGHFIAPSVNFFSSSGNANRSCFNFGNGYFETTAVSSAGTNASGVGIFEYNVPTNYTSWSTKGLNL